MGKKAVPVAAPVEEEKPAPPPEPVGEQLEGEFVFQDGATYVGQYWKANEEVSLHGYGTLVTGPESFRGSFEKGEYKEGKYVACGGAVYTGAFRDNLFHGVGEYEWPDGRAYKGMWKDGLMHGWGQCLNFSFGAEKAHTGFAMEGRFASSREEQEELKRRYLDAYCAEHVQSAGNALKDLAARTTPDGAPREYLVPARPSEEEEEAAEAVAERVAVAEVVDGPFPDASAIQQAVLQAFAARFAEQEVEKPLTIIVFEDKVQLSRFDGRRLKREQLQHAGQAVEFRASDAEAGSLALLVLVNVSTEYDAGMARWKLVCYEEASAA